MTHPDIKAVAEAMWNWEHEGRSNAIIDVEWSLLKSDYEDKAKAAILAMLESGVIKVVREALKYYAEAWHPIYGGTDNEIAEAALAKLDELEKPL